jgi:hypothetical protein
VAWKLSSLGTSEMRNRRAQWESFKAKIPLFGNANWGRASELGEGCLRKVRRVCRDGTSHQNRASKRLPGVFFLSHRSESNQSQMNTPKVWQSEQVRDLAGEWMAKRACTPEPDRKTTPGMMGPAPNFDLFAFSIKHRPSRFNKSATYPMETALTFGSLGDIIAV